MFTTKSGKALRAVTVALAVVSVGACGSDTPTEPDVLTVDDLAGVWEMSTFSFMANDSELGFELIEAGGTGTFSIQPGGSFTGNVMLPAAVSGVGDVTFPISGVMRMADDNAHLRIDFIPEIPPFFTAMEPTIELVGNTMTLIDTESDFDFDQDGVVEAATMNAVVVRR